MFWQEQALRDTLFIVAVIGWGLLITLLVMAPGLVGFALTAYRYHRSESINLYLARFIPPALFNLLIDLSRYLLLAVILIGGGVSSGLVPATLSDKPLAITVGGLVGGLLVLSLLRRLSFALWSYLFMDKRASELLYEDYSTLAALKALLFIPLTFLALSSVTAVFALYGLVVLMLLTIVLRIWQTFSRLGRSFGDYVYIFLYLCTHELLPWAYLALVVFLRRGALF